MDFQEIAVGICYILQKPISTTSKTNNFQRRKNEYEEHDNEKKCY